MGTVLLRSGASPPQNNNLPDSPEDAPDTPGDDRILPRAPIEPESATKAMRLKRRGRDRQRRPSSSSDQRNEVQAAAGDGWIVEEMVKLTDPLGEILANELRPFVRVGAENGEICVDDGTVDGLQYNDFLETAEVIRLSNVLYSSMKINDREGIQNALEAGANVNNVNLRRAARMQHNDVVQKAVELGFDVNKLIGDGEISCTLLHIIAMQHNCFLITLLLDRNADVSIPDSNGLTPLHYVIHQGHQETLELLLSYSTNKLLLPMKSMLELAIKCQRQEITDRVVEHIALVESQGPFVDPDTYELINEHLNARDYFNICKRELEHIKESFVGDLISYHDFFIDEELNRVVRDDGVTDAFRTCTVEKMFPIFGKIIRQRYDRQKNKIDFENLVINNLSQIFGFDLWKRRKIYRRIMNYLPRQDLYNLSIINRGHFGPLRVLNAP